jgi:hypothetical protein
MSWSSVQKVQYVVAYLKAGQWGRDQLSRFGYIVTLWVLDNMDAFEFRQRTPCLVP